MTLATDLRYALRSIRLRPLWAATATLTLALGIGANATMFTLVDRLLVRPPPHVRDARRVVRLAQEYDDRRGGRFAMQTTSWPVFGDVASARGFDALAAVAERSMVFGTGADARSVEAALVTGAYFALLGTRPALGRFIGESDDRPPVGEPVVVISYGFWRRAFDAARDVVGRAVTLDGARYRVIGVAPPDFTGDDVEPLDAWVPLHAAQAGASAEWRTARALRLVRIIGRLRDGVAADAAAAEATLAFRHGMEGFAGADSTARVQLNSAQPGWRERRDATAQGRVAVWVAAMSVVVLLIAMVNVTHLLLLRAAGRRREIAVRLAIGASHQDLARALLVESLVLALIGGAAAVAVAVWGGELVRATLLPGLAGPDRLVSLRLVAITCTATLAAGLLTGIVPAVRAGRGALAEVLKAGSGVAGRPRARATAAFLVAQGSLCMVLLGAASLFLLSLHRVRTQDFGFRGEGVLLATMRFAGSVPGPTQDALYRQGEEQLRRLAGVEAVSVVQVAPFSGHNVPPIAVPGREDFPDQTRQAPFLNAATPTYFRVLGMTIREGRNFTEADGAPSPLVVIVNQAMAEGLWPGASALGRCIRVGFLPGALPTGIHASPLLPCREIVGVVNNARPRSVREEEGQARMQYYVPFGQIPRPFFAAAGPQIWALLVRTGDAEAMAAPVRRTLQSFAPDLPFAVVRPLMDVLERQMRPWMLGATMFTAFGLLALGLAAVGLYGARAYAVTQRTQEIGIRMALGAGRGVVVRMVLWEGVRVALAGAVLGALIAVAAGGPVEPLLFETSVRDARVFAFVGLVLVLVAVAASAVPAWRAARVDPIVALRAE